MHTDETTGLRYRVRHDRATDYRGFVDQKGGKTTVEIVAPDGSVLAIGEASARPDENYNRRLGRTIALGRARKRLELSMADPPRAWRASLVDFADLWRLATREADAAGTCFVHYDGAVPASYVLLSPQRYRDLIDRVVPGGEGIPVDDPDWGHSHVEPEMLGDLAVTGGLVAP